MNKAAQAEDMLRDYAVNVGAASANHAIILPGSGVTIKATAEELFKRIGPTNTLFVRGGAVMYVVEKNAALQLDVLGPIAARSRFESYGTFFAYRSGRDGTPVLKETIMAQDMAAALLESEEARKYLPSITGLVNCPLIDGGLRVVGQGYQPDTGLFITGGRMPETVELQEAIAALQELVSEFYFQSPGDRSRALAAFVTPALKLGEHLRGNMPADVAEADKSQAGKGFRQKLIAAVYNEKLSLVTLRSGGVGSVDESLNEKLIAGRPFIQLDNFRGKLDSPHTEALLTAEKTFPVRVPHCREVEIDPSRFFVMLTSNGVETTRDFANRSSIVRIRKHEEGFKFHKYPEGDLLAHMRACQPYYLGAVFTIIKRWVELGCQRSNETRHDFREWAQTLDWIVQNILNEKPLMDDHQAAQERVSNPGLTFLRKLALAIAEQNRLGEWLNASALYEIADGAEVDIPGLREPDEDRGRRLIGSIMARLFKAECVAVEEFTVTRQGTEMQRDAGGPYIAKSYKFRKVAR